MSVDDDEDLVADALEEVAVAGDADEVAPSSADAVDLDRSTARFIVNFRLQGRHSCVSLSRTESVFKSKKKLLSPSIDALH